MLIKKKHLDGILEGSISLAFRRWKRPTVRAGGALRTRFGIIAIEAMEVVTEDSITHDEARNSGFKSREELLHQLNLKKEGDIYRIRLHYGGEDPRIRLRSQDKLSQSEVSELKNRLARFDKASLQGPWTMETLQIIAQNPGKRATDLAASLNREKFWFKTNVRKLKELGLTESLSPGYRLSPRGREFLTRLLQLP
jgi:hypothetical protein